MITSIEVSNFGPFRECVILDLANRGLVLIKGNNKVSQAADSNGAGKTSIAHAICWGYYGEDLNFRRADAVANRFTTETCSVTIHNEDARGKWVVVRTRRPAGFHVEGIEGVTENMDVKDIQEKIEQRLGFGLRTFRNAVVFGQQTFERFANADQKEKLRMLDEIQGIDFQEARERTKEWRDSLRTQHDDVVGQIEAYKAEQTAQAARVSDLTWVRDSFESSKQARVAQLEERLKITTSQLDEAERNLVVLEGDKKFLADRLFPAYTEHLRLVKHIQEAADVAWKAKMAVDAVLKKQNVQQEALDDLKKFAKCPTCRQPIKKWETIYAAFEPEIEVLMDALKSVRDVRSTAEKKHAEAISKMDAAAARLCELIPKDTNPAFFVGKLQGQTSDTAMRRAVGVRDEISFEIKNEIQRDLEVERSTCFDGEASLREAERYHADVSERLKKAIRVEGKLVQAIDIAEYWYEAFGDRGIRSLLVDSVSDFMNDRIAYHLDKLALGEAAAKMSSTTTLKKGGVKEGISFSRVWEWGGDKESDGSGGQDRRVDLAVFAAIQDVAEARSARPFPLKIYDEPADSLDARGQELFLEWIRSEAHKYGTALLITHNESVAAQANADEVWSVVLDEKGAKIE